MTIKYRPAILSVLLVAFLFAMAIGCATEQSPMAEEQPAATAEPEAEMAAEPVFTRDDPGPWAGKEASHVPVIAYEKTENGLSVTVTVNHIMDPDTPHYIEWIKLWDGDGNLLGEAEFKPTDELAQAVFEVNSAPEKLVAHEHCNLHGTWMEEAAVI